MGHPTFVAGETVEGSAVSEGRTLQENFFRGQSSDGIGVFGLKLLRQGGLHYLSHRIAGKRIEHQEARRKFVNRQ